MAIARRNPPRKIVLAYSGGLDTSVILTWLKETYDAEIVTYSANLGQTDEDLGTIRQKAFKTGASEAVVEDIQEEFVSEYVFPMLRAAAVYEGVYLLGTSIARPLIAKRQVEIAHKFGADAVAHGATGKGNDQVRFELTFAALAPELQVIAPWRTWNLDSRTKLIKYAKDHGIPVSATVAKPYSIDQNLLHTSYEGGILEDPWAAPPASMFLTTRDPRKAPAEPEVIEIDFVAGDPVAVNGKKLSPAKLLRLLNEIAGRHGIGRVDLVENRFVGMKSRGVYETPGGTVLHVARRAVESLTVDREALHLRDKLMPSYAEMVYYGFWFTPEREALQALVDKVTAGVEGTARLQLYKGSVQVLGRKAPRSLYRADLSTFEADTVYDQYDAEGFIRLNGLRLRVGSAVAAPADVPARKKEKAVKKPTAKKAPAKAKAAAKGKSAKKKR
jgi:argininosuccinate synthase